MSNVLLDQALPEVAVTDLKKSIRQTGQEIVKPTPYLGNEQTMFLPSIYSDLIFDQQSISQTRKLYNRWMISPSLDTQLVSISIDQNWVFANINRFAVSRRWNVYNDFVLTIELMLNGSPQTWGSIVSYFMPHGYTNFDYSSDLTIKDIVNTQQYMIQPVQINSKRTWIIPTDKPFDHFRARSGYPDNYRVGTFGISVLNTINSTSTVTSSPELQMWVSAAVTYGGTIYSGNQVL